MAISPPLTPTGVAALSAGSASSRVLIPATGTPTAIMITNLGPNDAFVLLGSVSVVATVATGTAVRAGADPVLLSIGANTYLAAITQSAALNAALNITAGT
jgi:hypothetical protein